MINAYKISRKKSQFVSSFQKLEREKEDRKGQEQRPHEKKKKNDSMLGILFFIHNFVLSCGLPQKETTKKSNFLIIK